jgi:hypothetical protein
MASHVVHGAVIAGVQPFLQVALVLTQFHIGDPHLLESQLCTPPADFLRQGCAFLCVDFPGH